jgi:hypothetical protein
VTALTYDAYLPMAERELRRIAEEVRERWQVSKVAIVHRVGTLSVGEISVAIVVSAPHRETPSPPPATSLSASKKSSPSGSGSTSMTVQRNGSCLNAACECVRKLSQWEGEPPGEPIPPPCPTTSLPTCPLTTCRYVRLGRSLALPFRTPSGGSLQATQCVAQNRQPPPKAVQLQKLSRRDDA